MTTNEYPTQSVIDPLTTAVQHCGCDRSHSAFKMPAPTRIGYCTWCWSAIKNVDNK